MGFESVVAAQTPLMRGGGVGDLTWELQLRADEANLSIKLELVVTGYQMPWIRSFPLLSSSSS